MSRSQQTTERLRRRLSELGVPYVEYPKATEWVGEHGETITAYPAEQDPSKLVVKHYKLTPAQAVGATVGHEACQVETRESEWGGTTLHCGGCGADLGCDTRNRQRYCPRCGRRIVGL